jgi:hypothetical protein
MINRPHLQCTHIEKSVACRNLLHCFNAIGWMDLSEDDIKDIRRKSGVLSESVPAPEDVVRPGTKGTPATPAQHPAEQTTGLALPSTMQTWARFEKGKAENELATVLQRTNELLSKAG